MQALEAALKRSDLGIPPHPATVYHLRIFHQIRHEGGKYAASVLQPMFKDNRDTTAAATYATTGRHGVRQPRRHAVSTMVVKQDANKPPTGKTCIR